MSKQRTVIKAGAVIVGLPAAFSVAIYFLLREVVFSNASPYEQLDVSVVSGLTGAIFFVAAISQNLLLLLILRRRRN